MAATQKRVAVVGGSLAGLSAAVLLEREGMDVSVFEKRADYQQVTGGGIVVQKVVCDLLDEAGEGVSGTDPRLALSGRQFLDEHGVPKSAMEAPQHAGSWSSVWRALRAAFKEDLHSVVKDSRLSREGIFSVPPGMLGERVEEELRRLARLELPSNLRNVVDVTKQPFLQPIVDYKAPRMLFHGGRAALLGDAACVLRPHTTYGTAKAVEEARGLVEAMRAGGGGALQEWEASALARNESLVRYGDFLGQSQRDRDAREKLRSLQGQRLDSSSGAEAVLAAVRGGA